MKPKKPAGLVFSQKKTQNFANPVLNRLQLCYILRCTVFIYDIYDICLVERKNKI